MKTKPRKWIAAGIALAGVIAVSIFHIPAPVVAAVQQFATSLTQDAQHEAHTENPE